MRGAKLSAGAELKDSAELSHNHDVFVLIRPTNSTAVGAGCCTPTTLVTFKEPGAPTFQLELPINSSLKSVKEALASATRPTRREDNTNGSREHHQRCQQRQQHQIPEDTTRMDCDKHEEGDARDCTLIVRGKKMSNSCLLGDYFMGVMRKPAAGIVCARRANSERMASILVLWHPPRIDEPSRAASMAAAVVTAHHHPRRVSWSPFAGLAAAAHAIPTLNRSQEEQAEQNSTRRRPSRRSVQRRCKSALRFSGMSRGVRRGLGIRSQP